MPPKPRNIHLPATGQKYPSSVSTPTPAHNLINPPYPTWKPPKPHLARYASISADVLASASAPYPITSEASSSRHAFTPPQAPQLPKRRQPAFNPGGFGMQSAPLPAPGFGKGKGKVLSEVERRTEEIRMEELRQEGGPMTKEGQEEAEACYVPPPATLHFQSPDPLPLLYSPAPLPPYTIAYETWGSLNSSKSNAILLHTGLSASSHVASNGNDVSPSTSSKPGWWEDFVGPGKAIDTDRFFVICTNTLGGCFGSTGPSSPLPGGESNVRWATRFPLLSIHDMVRGQLGLLDYLGIEKLYASVGSSMGGMQSLSLAYLAPERVGRVASISACGRAGLGGVGMRYAQRSVLMADPNWNRGFYYDDVPPHNGMKLARQIATITYRSGPEWEQRFGRRMLSEKEGDVPRLSPDFLIETYLDHQGERFCLTYDANSMIYLSKAMDLFDMTAPALQALAERYEKSYIGGPVFPYPTDPVSVSASSTSRPSSSSTSNSTDEAQAQIKRNERFIPTSKSPHLQELAQGLKRLREIPTLVLGVQSDVLFPVEQQRELADALKLAGNERVTYYELGGVWGHDTFLLDVQNVGGALRGFLN